MDLKRDRRDDRGALRTLAGFVLSLFVHALLAALLFSVLTSSSEQSAPEAFSNSAVLTVSAQAPQQPQRAAVSRAAVPVPNAPRVSREKSAALPHSAALHPQVRHEISKFAPTAPPNPTPQPIASAAPNPAPTQPVIAVTAAPLEPAAPTSAPAAVVAAAIRAPATPAPQPTAAPKLPSTPKPQPSPLRATSAPLLALATARPAETPGSPQRIPAPHPAPQATANGAAQTPGPKPLASSGPSGASAANSRAAPRPIQPPPATPRPAAPRRVSSAPARAHETVNQRLRSLIPTSAPTTAPHAAQHYSFLKGLTPTPEPEPTPPPQVLAQTRFLYVENVASQRWKQSILGTAPEETFVKMYVTSVRRIGPIAWCSGWVVRSPIAGTSKYIVEPDEHLICSGKLTPFTPPSPEPTKGS